MISPVVLKAGVMQTMLSKDSLSHTYLDDPEKLAIIVALGPIHGVLMVICWPPNIGPELGLIAWFSLTDQNAYKKILIIYHLLSQFHFNFITNVWDAESYVC